ncbi:hypothetical protein NHX12_027909 [Muraenolepis orangiensis]|uniref:Uncharacterized protein n=1 Tax=Muraenolepis orangiensis TaxID=630683 RepID=A0A9Q0EHJ8_9TELE|nr:hypothetical protein NHX12_027909 [Muraenolepis orangiensis]
MSVARIHDKHKLKSFWEGRIQQHTLVEGVEQSREKDICMQLLLLSCTCMLWPLESILCSLCVCRLREDWLRRLTQRNQNQQSFFEEQIHRRAREAQWLATHFP